MFEKLFEEIVFEGDPASEREILRLVDDAHTAAAKLSHDAVVRDGLADHQKMCGLRVASSYGRGGLPVNAPSPKVSVSCREVMHMRPPSLRRST